MTAVVEIAGAKLFDLILGEAFHGALGRVMAGRARMAREEIVKQLEKGELGAIADDDAAAAMFTYIRAAQEGAARINLRMMAEAFVNASREPTFAPNEFRHQSLALASLSRDEVLLLAALLRANQHAASQAITPSVPPATELASAAWVYVMSDPSQFPAGFDATAVAAALSRTGWIVPGAGYGSITYYTTAAFDGVARLVDFELARMDLETQSHA